MLQRQIFSYIYAQFFTKMWFLFLILRTVPKHTVSPEEVWAGREDEPVRPDVLGTADEGDIDKILFFAYVSECGHQRLMKVVPLEAELLVATAASHDRDRQPGKGDR